MPAISSATLTNMFFMVPPRQGNIAFFAGHIRPAPCRRSIRAGSSRGAPPPGRPDAHRKPEDGLHVGAIELLEGPHVYTDEGGVPEECHTPFFRPGTLSVGGLASVRCETD